MWGASFPPAMLRASVRLRQTSPSRAGGYWQSSACGGLSRCCRWLDRRDAGMSFPKRARACHLTGFCRAIVGCAANGRSIRIQSSGRGYRLSSACGGLLRRIRKGATDGRGVVVFPCSNVGPGPDLRDYVRRSWGGARYSSPDSIARPDVD